MTIHLSDGRFFGDAVAERSTAHLDLVLTRYEAGERLPLHAHERPYLALVSCGGFREQMGGVAFDCVAGSLVLNTVAAEHCDHFVAERTEVLNVALAPDWLEGLRADGWEDGRPAWIGHLPVRRTILGLCRELARPESLSPFVIEGLCAELVGCAARTPPARRSPLSAAPPWLARIERVLAERFRRPPGLTELGRLADVSPTHLARAFRARHGISVGGFARRLRGEHARNAVLHSRRELAEIALEAGYADQSHMTRELRRHFGCTPGELRAR